MKVAAFIFCLLLAVITSIASLDRADKLAVRIVNACAAIIFMAAALFTAYRGI